MAKVSGRHGRPWRRIREQVLSTSDVCWLCGHGGADSADHVIPLSAAPELAEEISNLRPAHHQPCPDCGIRCNTRRGAGKRKQSARQSRNW